MRTNLMVYIAGDNNLDTFGTDDIGEMMSVPYTGDDLTILVQQDQSEKARDSGTKRFVIRHGKKEKTIHLGETNTGDATALIDFLSWGMENFEADRNIAVLWNHGGGTKDEILPGFENAINSTASRSVVDNSRVEAKGTFFSQSAKLEQANTFMQEKQIEKGEPTRSMTDAESKAILFDDESKDFLDNLELKKVFDSLDNKLDIIGFDACLMNMLEVAYQLRDATEFVVGSEELEPGKGWDYEAIVSYLVDNPDASNEALSKAIVESFIDSYQNEPEQKLTLSAMRTEVLETLASDLNNFAYSILRHEKRIRRAFLAIVDETQTFDYKLAKNRRIYRDLKHFVMLTKEEYEDNDEIVHCANQLLETLEKLVLENRTVNFNHAHGVSVYLPLMPAMSEFALNVFSSLDINLENHAPYWFKLFKQVGNIDREPNYYYDENDDDDIINLDE